MGSSQAIHHILASAAALLVATPASAAAQGAPRVLEKPQVELAEPFTNVSSVRELRDGRVILVDNGDRAVYVVDFAAGTSTQIGRPGSGPAEYRIPGALLAMDGDTTFLTDGGNNRLLVIGPDAKPVATLTEAWPMLDGQRGTRLPRAVDARGRGYYIGSPVRVPAAEAGPVIQIDSVSLYRTSRGATTVDSLAFIHLAPRRITAAMKDGKIASVEIVTPPLPAQDAWQVFPDGTVGIVRVADYRAEWVFPDGRRLIGKAIPFDRVKVTELDKQRAANAMNGGRGRSAGAGNAARPMPQLDWPEAKPPFSYSATLAGSDGRLWVQRYVPATDVRTHYDVVDRRGVVAARVVVPNEGRIVGFGAKSIYVVRKDEDDLQYLQRFSLQ